MSTKIIHLFFLHYFYLVGSLIFFFLVGYFFLKCTKKHINIIGHHTGVFISLLIGIIISVTLYAMIITEGKTIFSAFFLIGAFLAYDIIYSEKKNIFQKFSNSTSDFLVLNYKTLAIDLFLFSFIIYAWEAFFIFKDGDFAYVIPHFDLLFYGELSDSLNQYKVENIFSVRNMVGVDFKGVTPYHYFDIWLDAFFSRVFNIKGVVAVLLLTYPLLVFITLTGFFALIETLTKPTLKWKIASLSFLFVSGIFFSFYKNINFLSDTDIYVVSPTYSIFKKLIIYYPFLILFFILFLRKSYYRAFLTLLCLPVISISTSYAVFGGVILFIFLDKFFFHSFTKDVLNKILIVTISVVMFKMLFYSILGSKVSAGIDIQDIFDFYSNQPKFIFTWRNISIGAAIHSLILYIPYIALFIIFFKKIKPLWNENLRIYITWLSCAFFSGLMGWMFFYFFIESIQFFYNFSFIPINLLIVYLFILLMKDHEISSFKRSPRYLICLVVFFALIGNQFFIAFKEKQSYKCMGNNNCSEKYIKDIADLNAKKELNGVGVFLYSKNFYTPDFNVLIIADFLGGYLPFLHGYHRTVNLSLFDIPQKNNYLDQFRIKKALESKMFYRFVMDQKAKGDFKSVEQSQIDFIDQYDIDYLILAKGGELTEELKSRVLKVITDSISGEQFILLKHY